MKVNVHSNCIGCGLCVSTCPEVFGINDKGIAEVLMDQIPANLEDSVQLAAESCPVSAIEVVAEDAISPSPACYIKNFPHETITSLSAQIEILPGQIASKTLAQNDAVSLTIFAFDKGEEIGTHDSTGDAMVTVLEGQGRFTVEGKPYILHAGETLIMPAGKPHSVYAVEAFKMTLTVIFPQV